MIFAETERLTLRALNESELPRLVELLNIWDIARWLPVLPFPYKMSHAEEFFADISPLYAANTPQFFAVALKADDALIGGVGLHPPRGATAAANEIEIGYWMGVDFWGQGLMSEAARAVVDQAFSRPETRSVSATTTIDNQQSQRILRKIGLHDKGIVMRDYPTLRGDDQIIKWLLTREEYQQGKRQ